MARRGDEKAGWRTGNTLPIPQVSTVDRMLAPWLDGRRVVGVEALQGGLMNRNCRVRIESSPDVVLRLYDRDAAAAAREIAVLNLLRGDVPVPAVFYAEPDPRDGTPFVVLEHVEGVSLRTLWQRGNSQAVQETAYDAGLLLGRLAAYRFPQAGLLTAALTVDASFVDGPVTTAALVELFASTQAFQRRVDVALHKRLLRSANEWDRRTPGDRHGATLVHGDFNSRNLFAARRGERWSVAAILDWEFAFAGSPFCDIGNFLRYERASRPRFEPFFSRGCRDGGLALEGDWLAHARVADLPALCEFLARESTPADVVGEVLDLVAVTLDQIESGRASP